MNNEEFMFEAIFKLMTYIIFSTLVFIGLMLIAMYIFNTVLDAFILFDVYMIVVGLWGFQQLFRHRRLEKQNCVEIAEQI